jgi:RNA-directed DNA polymerase
MKAKLDEVKEELQRRMHRPIPELGKWLNRVVSSFFNHHAVATNSRTLAIFRHRVTVLWQRTLRRRSQKDRTSWDRMAQRVDDWLARPRILHPRPSERFAVRHQRWEPYAGKPQVRICAGGAQSWASLPRSGTRPAMTREDGPEVNGVGRSDKGSATKVAARQMCHVWSA